MEVNEKLTECFNLLSQQGMVEEKLFASTILECMVVYFKTKLGASRINTIKSEVGETNVTKNVKAQALETQLELLEDQEDSKDLKDVEADNTKALDGPTCVETSIASKSTNKENKQFDLETKEPVKEVDDLSLFPNRNVETTSKLGSVCSYCPFSVEELRIAGKYTRSRLLNHMKNIHNVCDICREQLTNLDQLESHVISIHTGDDGEFVCGINGCAKKKTSRSKMLEHVKAKHDNVQYICKECNIPYKDKKAHRAEHVKKPQRLNCTICEGTLQSKSGLKKHMKMYHTELVIYVESLACNQCSYKTAATGPSMKHEIYRMSLHKRVHREGNLICDECNFVTKTPFAFNRHWREKHDNAKIHECAICHYRNHQKSRYDIHMARHTRERVFECDKCDYKAYVKEDLKGHQNKHADSPKYLCDQCDYTTWDSGNFLTHKTVRHGTVILECENCDYKTKSARSLRQHKLKHSP
jgi:KRAB domain-containing zinc finger protein